MQAGVPAALLSSQLLAKWPWEAADDDPRIRVPATHQGDLDGVPGSWLPPGPALAVAGF